MMPATFYLEMDNISFRVHQDNLQDSTTWSTQLDLAFAIARPSARYAWIWHTASMRQDSSAAADIDELVDSKNNPSRRTNHNTGHFQFFFSIGEAF